MRPAAVREHPVGKGKVETAIFLAAGLVETAFFGQLVAFTPGHLLTLGIPHAEIGYFSGLVASVTMFIAFPALQRWGLLTDQLTRKQLIVRSFLLDAVVALAAILAHRPWIFLLGRAVSLATMDSNGLILNFIKQNRTPERSRLQFTLLTLAPQLGVFLGPLVGSFLLDGLGFKALMTFNLFLLLLLAVLFQRLVPSMDVAREYVPLMGIMKSSFALVIRSARISMLFLSLTLMVAAWMLVFSYLPLTASDLAAGSAPAQVVGLVVGVGGLAGVLIGCVFSRTGATSREWTALAACLVGGAAFSLLVRVASDVLQLALLWAMIVSLATAGFSRLFRLVAHSTAQASVALVLSLAILPVNGGMILGPVVGSYVSSPNVEQVYPVAALFCLLGLGALILARWLPAPGMELNGDK